MVHNWTWSAAGLKALTWAVKPFTRQRFAFGAAMVPSGKFKLVHALRGIAATWVVFFHAFWGEHITHLYEALPKPIAEFVFLRGFFGVEIFFVLSGFIIAHSVRDARITGRYLGNFAVRRSLRLDPPYWAAILFAVVMASVSAKVVHKQYTVPGIEDLIAHVTYTQVILGFPEINGVFWTLTYEVQFYLVLITSLLIFQKLAKHLSTTTSAIIVFAPLYIIAWVWGVFIFGDKDLGFFWIKWYGFFAGALGYWAASNRRLLIPFWALAAGLLFFGRDVSQACSLTAVLLHVALKRGSIVSALGWAPLQFLGTISYSLYLIHTPVQGASMFLLYRFIPRTVAGETLALFLSFLVCVAGSWVFWWAIERPSHEFAKRFGRLRRQTIQDRGTEAPTERLEAGATPEVS